MNTIILTKTYTEPPVSEKEILRYAGCQKADRDIQTLLTACLDKARDKLVYKVCYGEFPVATDGNLCDFGAFRVSSQHLAANIKDCHTVILFAATVGVGLDRLIAKYGHLSPAKALLFQAIGAERIEALCDRFCEDISQERNMGLTPRFSPGYGDLPLEVQKNLFAVLDCGRRIGLTLTDSLLMSPSKSVTAFVGLTPGKERQIENKCSACYKQNCTFRGAL